MRIYITKMSKRVPLFMNNLKQLLRCSVVVVALLNSVHGDKCPFPLTHQVLQNVCDWSKWLPWDCKCCGSDVQDQVMAKRQRGICCIPHQNIKDCLNQCGYLSTDDTEYGLCSVVCPNTTGGTRCPSSIRTTLSTTESTSTSTQPVNPSKKPNTMSITNPSTHTSISPSNPSTQTTSPSNQSTIVNLFWTSIYLIPIVAGAVAGIIVATCVPLCLICLLCKRKRDKRKQVDTVIQPQTDSIIGKQIPPACTADPVARNVLSIQPVL